MRPSSRCWKRLWTVRRRDCWPTACCPTIGIWSSGRGKTGNCPDLRPWLTLTHTQRRHARRRSSGTGHVYQGRFKSFPVQEDEHFHTVCRYVERNALRANLSPRAEQWRWGSLYRWKHGTAKAQAVLTAWPLPRRPSWVEQVNAPQSEAELAALRRCVQRGNPFGEESWCDRIVRRLGLESTLRPQGRPQKHKNGS